MPATGSGSVTDLTQLPATGSGSAADLAQAACPVSNHFIHGRHKPKAQGILHVMDRPLVVVCVKGGDAIRAQAELDGQAIVGGVVVQANGVLQDTNVGHDAAQFDHIVVADEPVDISGLEHIRGLGQGFEIEIRQATVESPARSPFFAVDLEGGSFRMALFPALGGVRILGADDVTTGCLESGDSREDRGLDQLSRLACGQFAISGDKVILVIDDQKQFFHKGRLLEMTNRRFWHSVWSTHWIRLRSFSQVRSDSV